MAITEFTWVNTMIGNVKNSLHGTYHAVQPKHLGRYLADFSYRFNRRFQLDRLVSRLAGQPAIRRHCPIVSLHWLRFRGNQENF